MATSEDKKERKVRTPRPKSALNTLDVTLAELLDKEKSLIPKADEAERVRLIAIKKAEDRAAKAGGDLKTVREKIEATRTQMRDALSKKLAELDAMSGEEEEAT